MNNAYHEETAFTTLLLLVSAMPGVSMMNRREEVEKLLAQDGFDLATYRTGLDLSDTALDGTFVPVQKGTHDWWINEFRVGEDLENILDLEVYFENGSKVNRVLGVDKKTNRILVGGGRVYQLGKRLVSPIEVSVSVKPAPHVMVSSESFLGGDDVAQVQASRYVEQREEDAMKFFKELKWDTNSKGFRYCVEANIYGVKIVHEMQPCALHAGAVWGELFFPNSPEREPIIFHTFDQFVAYMLAKYW